MRKKGMYIREFKCPVCGSHMFSPKRITKQTPTGHIKTTYCYKCKEIRNFIQLNKYGDEEYDPKLNIVRMRIMFKIPSFDNLLDFGCNVKDITLIYGDRPLTIGFLYWNWSIDTIDTINEETTIIVESGYGELNDSDTIDMNYIQQIKEQGFDPEILDAKFLCSMNEIVGINLQAHIGNQSCKTYIEGICFMNGDEVLFVDPVILEKYNSIL